jgi:WD40 repeat protein
MGHHFGILAAMTTFAAAAGAPEAAENDGSRSIAEYASSIRSAFNQMANGDGVGARAALERTEPALRAWEYVYIDAALNDAKTSGVLSGFPRRVLVVFDVPFGPMCGFSSGSELVLPCDDGVARLADVYAQKSAAPATFIRSLTVGAALTFAACASDSKWVAISTDDGHVSIRNAQLEEVRSIKVGDSLVKNLALSPSGEQVAAATCGGEVALWNAKSGEKIATIGESYTFGRPIVFTPDGSKVALGGGLENIELFDAKTGKPAGEIGPHAPYIMSIAFSRDGKWVATGASGSMNKSIAIFEVATGRRVALMDEHTRDINSLAFSPDSTRLLSASFDGTLRLWHVPSGTGLLRLNVGTPCGDVQFMDQGKAIVWASRFGFEVASTR